jgi:hemophore-related protein
MMKVSLIRLAVAAGGLALSLGAGAGIASAGPDLGWAVNTTCTYPQLVAALNAQSAQAGDAFNQSPIMQKGLQDFLAAGPEKRQRVAQNVANAPAFQPYLGIIEEAFNTCNNFAPS